MQDRGFCAIHCALCIAVAAFAATAALAAETAANAADLFVGKAPTETVEVPADLKTGEFVLTFDATFPKGAPRQFLLRQYFTCDNGARDLYTHIGFAGENGRLYVYSTDNPALLSHDIRVAVRENGVKLHSHTVVSDLAVRAVGAHGIFAGWRATPTIDIRISDCVFENCSFTGNRTINVGGGWGSLTRPNRHSATPLLVYSTETDTVDIDVSGNTFENAPRGLIFKRGGIDTLPPGYRIHDNTVR